LKRIERVTYKVWFHAECELATITKQSIQKDATKKSYSESSGGI